jgi:hypothetical protein
MANPPRNGGFNNFNGKSSINGVIYSDFPLSGLSTRASI